MTDEWIVRGTLGSPHGVDGALKLVPRTDYPERLLGVDRYLLRDGSGAVADHEVEWVREHRGQLLVKLQGVDDRDAALRFRGQQVVVRPDELPAPVEGRYYWHQLVGLRVETEAGEPVGRITEVLSTGSNEVWVTDAGPLIPDIPEVVQTVDLPAGRVVIRPMPGLLD